ncbi:hypothetical protein [Ralstonia pseudosolanacearum]
MASRKYSEPGMGLRHRPVRRDGCVGRARDLLDAWVSRHAGTPGLSARGGLIGAASASRIAGTRIDRNGSVTAGWVRARLVPGTLFCGDASEAARAWRRQQVHRRDARDDSARRAAVSMQRAWV